MKAAVKRRWDKRTGLLKSYRVKKKAPSVGRSSLYLVRVSLRPELHKIGISSNTNLRFESFEEDNPKKNTVLKVIVIRNARKHEAFLLDYFSNRARYYEPLSGNGATEVFALTWLDLAICILYMWRVDLLQRWKVRALLFVLVFLTFTGGFYYLDPDFAVWAFKKLWLWVRNGITFFGFSGA